MPIFSNVFDLIEKVTSQSVSFGRGQVYWRNAAVHVYSQLMFWAALYCRRQAVEHRRRGRGQDSCWPISD
jgi:arabinogalactan endo-1,4-beta-galactosidase